MRKFGIITHYDVHNHGALLQLTALKRVLATKGIEAKALRFDKNYDFLGPELKAKYDISVRSVGIYARYMMERGAGITLYNVRKKRTLERFKAVAELVGDYYSRAEGLECVVVGSDEVFALHTGPTPVFFGHCLPTESVIAYAGSFGPTTAEDVRQLHCEALVSSGLRGMKAVSVRDENSVKAVRELTGEDVPKVVDPVLLYGYEKEIAALPKVAEKPYLLVYAYDNRMNSPEEVKAVKDYAAKRGLKVVSAGFYHKWCDRNVNVDPIGLLAWFRDAAEVVTDTFHGSVMSIITGARVAVKTRESNHLKLSNLMREYGMTERIFTEWGALDETMARPMDNIDIAGQVERRRAESMGVLEEMLKLCER